MTITVVTAIRIVLTLARCTTLPSSNNASFIRSSPSGDQRNRSDMTFTNTWSLPSSCPRTSPGRLMKRSLVHRLVVGAKSLWTPNSHRFSSHSHSTTFQQTDSNSPCSILSLTSVNYSVKTRPYKSRGCTLVAWILRHEKQVLN